MVNRGLRSAQRVSSGKIGLDRHGGAPGFGAREGDLTDEDQLRAQYYRLLSRLLVRPADDEMLSLVAALEGGNGPVGDALDQLANAASAASPDDVDDEFHTLFIGLGRGELVPFGSFYLAGFLMEKPLAKLRQDMARLGIERTEGVSEPEDHIASLCEMMAGLIDGSFGEPSDLADQRSFFDRHIGPWAGKFFEDLETAEAAVFYRAVGTVGRAFLLIETAALDMAA